MVCVVGQLLTLKQRFSGKLSDRYICLIGRKNNFILDKFAWGDFSLWLDLIISAHHYENRENGSRK